MNHYPFSHSNHEFEKQNLMTIMSRRGGYDILKCKNCGITARSYQLGIVKSSASPKCRKAPKETIRAIQITRCEGVGKQFANLLPNSIHNVITPPKGYTNGERGYWVMGVGEPVLVLFNELIIVK